MASELTVEKDQHGHHDHEDHHGEDRSQKELWQGGEAPFKASYGKLMMWYFLVSDAFTFAGFLIAYGTLRVSMPSWPVPDFVFQTMPTFGFIPESWTHHAPLIFVTIMTFILIVSSVTMVRAVQEGHVGNKKGVIFWMLLTIIGGAAFLGCQAWEWNTLIKGESMSITRNPFGRHEVGGVYLNDDHGKDYAKGQEVKFEAKSGYLLHAVTDHDTGEKIYDKDGKLQFHDRKVRYDDGTETVLGFGPRAFGALFFSITGFHGFHVFSGVAFLLIVLVNVASGLYEKRKNHYEMVEKIGLYWHFVDLVWVFVFLVFYLL
jgi:cytochrome c oxidase subunit III